MLLNYNIILCIFPSFQECTFFPQVTEQTIFFLFHYLLNKLFAKNSFPLPTYQIIRPKAYWAHADCFKELIYFVKSTQTIETRAVLVFATKRKNNVDPRL